MCLTLLDMISFDALDISFKKTIKNSNFVCQLSTVYLKMAEVL